MFFFFYDRCEGQVDAKDLVMDVKSPAFHLLLILQIVTTLNIMWPAVIGWLERI